jgi:TusA-related sulfurtransferase
MSNIKANAFVDITDVVCPVTFVKAKVALENIEKGQILEIKLNAGEPIQNVPRSLKNEKHKVLSVKDNNDETYTITVEKKGLE